MNANTIKEFKQIALDNYLHCALWTDEYNADINRFPIAERERAAQDIWDVLSKLTATEFNHLVKNKLQGQFGHDLWLTRNRHGSGFWDLDVNRCYGKELSEKLTTLAENLGEKTIFGQQGWYYFE